MVGYIKKSHKCSNIKEWLCILTIEEFASGYIIKLPNIQGDKKEERVIKKLLKKIQKLKIDTVAFSKDLKKEEKAFQLFLEKYKINNKKEAANKVISKNNKYPAVIVNGKTMMKYLNLAIFEYILAIQGKNKKQEDIYILLQRDRKIDLAFLQQFIENFKTVNIVTNDLIYFKKLQEKLYEQEDILISVSNNKKKALKRAKYILNYNFSHELLKKYKINRNAIIVNNEINMIDAPAGFEGIIINRVEIHIADEILEKYEKVINSDHFDNSKLYESHLCDEFKNSIELQYNGGYSFKIKPEVIQDYFKRDEIYIQALIGINGKINKTEIKKLCHERSK